MATIATNATTTGEEKVNNKMDMNISIDQGPPTPQTHCEESEDENENVTDNQQNDNNDLDVEEDEQEDDNNDMSFENEEEGSIMSEYSYCISDDEEGEGEGEVYNPSSPPKTNNDFLATATANTVMPTAGAKRKGECSINKMKHISEVFCTTIFAVKCGNICWGGGNQNMTQMYYSHHFSLTPLYNYSFVQIIIIISKQSACRIG